MQPCLKLLGSLGVDDELPTDITVIGERKSKLGFVDTYVKADHTGIQISK